MKAALLFSKSLIFLGRSPVEYFINTTKFSLREPSPDDMEFIKGFINVQSVDPKTIPSVSQTQSEEIIGAVKTTIPCDLINTAETLVCQKNIESGRKTQVAFFGRLLISKEKNNNGKKDESISQLICAERVSPENDDFRITFSGSDEYDEDIFKEGSLELLSVIAEAPANGKPTGLSEVPKAYSANVKEEVDLILKSILIPTKSKIKPDSIELNPPENEEIDRLLKMGREISFLNPVVNKLFKILIRGLVDKDKTKRPLSWDRKQLEILARVDLSRYDCLEQLINLAKVKENKDWKPTKYFLHNPTVFFADTSLTTDGPIREELKWRPISGKWKKDEQWDFSKTKVPYTYESVKESLKALVNDLNKKNGARETTWDITSLKRLIEIDFSNYPDLNKLIELANAEENKTSLPAVYFLQNSTVSSKLSESASSQLFSKEENKEIEKLAVEYGEMLYGEPVIRKLIEMFISGLKDKDKKKTILSDWGYHKLKLLRERIDFSKCKNLNELIKLANANENRYLLPVKHFMLNPTVYQKYLADLK